MSEFINRIKIRNQLLKKILKAIRQSPEVADPGQKVVKTIKARAEWKKFLSRVQAG